VRVVAVDWSGSVSARGRTTWACEVRDGEPVFLRGGFTAPLLHDLLCTWAEATPEMVVGLDFAFALPAWYMRERGWGAARELWRDAALHADAWLAECAPPFWGRPGRRRPADPGGPHLRRTEELVPAMAGIRPKSAFQVGGAGAVGTGSLRGMALLHSLAARGFSVWPFDPAALPRVVEIYPRALTGPVRKSDPAARRDHLDRLAWPADPAVRALAASTEYAFDAALSARAMWLHRDELAALGPAADAEEHLEGAIWLPPLGAG